MDQTLMSMFVLKQIYVQLEESNPQPGEYIPLELILVDKFTKMIYLQQNVSYQLHLSKTLDDPCGMGLIPIPGKSNGDTKITTEGLKYEMGEEQDVSQLSWDTMISTSNELGDHDKFELKIRSEGQPLIFTTTL